MLRYFEAIGTGGIKDAFIGNLIFLGGRWADLFASVRFPKVLGMFVLGLWTVRTGIALSPMAGRNQSASATEASLTENGDEEASNWPAALTAKVAPTGDSEP